MLAVDYIIWHYSEALGGILGLLRNYTRANWHRFLIARHFQTLFAPWHRRQPSDVGGGGFGTKILDAIADFYIRLLAAGVRLIIILIGLIAELLTAAGFILLLLIWILWPVILVYSIGKGFGLVF